MNLRSIALVFWVILVLGLFGYPQGLNAKTPPAETPHWLQSLPIPQNEELFLVVKGTYPSLTQAQKIQGFIAQLMGTTPPDRIDTTDKYPGVNSGKFLVGMLFDSRERAQWWIDFSYRNRTIPKGQVHRVKVQGNSELPYMPDAVRQGKKRLLTQSEALAKVKALSDIQQLSLRKKLIYKFTDFPRNGDLRYEIEVLEEKEKKDPLMVDFIMVSALTGDITERLSFNLRKDILREH